MCRPFVCVVRRCGLPWRSSLVAATGGNHNCLAIEQRTRARDAANSAPVIVEHVGLSYKEPRSPSPTLITGSNFSLTTTVSPFLAPNFDLLDFAMDSFTTLPTYEPATAIKVASTSNLVKELADSERDPHPCRGWCTIA